MQHRQQSEGGRLPEASAAAWSDRGPHVRQLFEECRWIGGGAASPASSTNTRAHFLAAIFRQSGAGSGQRADVQQGDLHFSVSPSLSLSLCLCSDSWEGWKLIYLTAEPCGLNFRVVLGQKFAWIGSPYCSESPWQRSGRILTRGISCSSASAIGRRCGMVGCSTHATHQGPSPSAGLEGSLVSALCCRGRPASNLPTALYLGASPKSRAALKGRVAEARSLPICNSCRVHVMPRH